MKNKLIVTNNITKVDCYTIKMFWFNTVPSYQTFGNRSEIKIIEHGCQISGFHQDI